MNQLRSKLGWGLVWVFCFFLADRAAGGAAERTNLVAILTDDQARWALGAYGNAEIHTPHIDRLAREGALFTEAFVPTPVCSPSRASYFTGRWPTELGITDWIAPLEAAAGLGLDAPSWPELLQASGYRTALIGKWHLGTQPQFHPRRRGFDHFMGFLGGGNRPVDPTLEVDGEERRLTGPLPDLLTDDAISFVRRNKSVPFLLCLHFRAPHLPYGPVPAEDTKPYEGLDPTVPDFPGADAAQLKRRTLGYYASITSVDRNVGRLLDALAECGLADKTLVLFTSDHGYNEGRHGINTKGNGHWMAGGVSGPKRPNMWDTSLRIPFIVRWPGVVQEGRVIDYPVSLLDMYRTLPAALGVGLPAGAKAHGRNLSPLLRGEVLKPRDALFGQYDLHNGGLAYLRMIRTPKYKYVRHLKTNFLDELYDLEADPEETINLARRGRQPPQEVIARLRARLSAWQRSIGDPLLERDD